MAEIIDKINFDYGYIEIENIKYHRGTIPLPKGTIYLETLPDTYQIFDVLYDFFREIGIPKSVSEQDYIEWLLYFLNANVNTAKFYTSYTEFLYPGSPDLGYNLEIEYVEEASIEDIEDWVDKLSRDIEEDVEFGKFPESVLENLNDFLNDETKYSEFIDKLYEAANSYIEKLNDYFYAAAETIYDYAEKLESAEYEEYEIPEEPESTEFEYEEYEEE